MKTASYFRSKRFRYGSVATAITVVFIALVVIFNVIFTAVSGKFLWYTDMTGSGLFTLSDEAKTIMSGVTAEVNIYFAEEEDVLRSSARMNYIYSTALQLAEEYPNINVECHDIITENVFFEKYKATAASSITATSVVVESGTEYGVYAADKFYVFDEDETTVWAYNGEYRFLSAILQVTASEKPVVYFTTGHSEDLNSASTLIGLFRDSGFDVKPIDLSKEDITEDARIIVIYDPLYDFIGYEAEDDSSDEIKKIDSFMDSLHHGCIMTFIDPGSVSELSNLNEFLEEWGIRYVPDTFVRDYGNSTAVDGRTIITEFNTDQEDFAGALYEDIVNLTNLPKAIVRNAAPIEIIYKSGGGLDGKRYTSSLLTSYASSEQVSDGNIVSKGSVPVMTASCEARIYDNNRYFSYVIAGTPSFASSNYLLSNSYANSDIMGAAMRVTGAERVLANISFKVFDNTELAITTAQANGWTAALTLVLPAFAAVCGVAVWLRRKHS